MNFNVKMSKYNLYTNDDEGNLLIYNFLKGLCSITKINKDSINLFKQLFIIPNEVGNEIVENHKETVDSLMRAGILVYSNINEESLLDERQYSVILDSKLTLTILPTGKCNFRCPYCFETPQSFSRETMSKESQKAIITYVQRNINHYNSLHISWFGGEPLLVPDSIQYLSDNFINICRKRYIAYSADVVTNGYFLNADMFELLYSLKVYEYMITVDGFKEQHDKRRFTATRNGSYDVIMENLLRIRDNKKYRFANITIRINMSHGFLEQMDDFILCLDGKEIILTSSQAQTIPYYCNNLMEYPSMQYFFAVGTKPDAIILCINYFDEISYIKNSIYTLMGLTDATVIALVMFPATFSNEWGGIGVSKRIITEKEFESKATELVNELTIPTYLLGNRNDLNRLCKNIVDFF